MNGGGALVSAPLGGAHPAVSRRRRRELLSAAVCALVPLALAFAISVAVPQPNYLLLAGAAVGAVGVAVLVASPRYQLSVLFVVIYLGLFEGPAKLGTGSHQIVASIRDILIFAISAGALMRLVVSRKRIELPPLAVWPLAFGALILVEVANPHNAGLTKIAGGLRQEAEWLPFFFFGYAIMRSTARFRRLFLLLGVLALVNGIVSVYQAKIGSSGLASWGPGYRELVYGLNGYGGRSFTAGGAEHIRPPGLGTDSGFAGTLGDIAICGTLALVAAGGMRRRWPVALLAIGALLGIAAGAARLPLVGAFVAVLAFVGLSFTADRRVTKTLAALLGVLALAIPAGAVLISLSSNGTYARFERLINRASQGEATTEGKVSGFNDLPHEISVAPFGVGLGTVGASAGFGGKVKELLEGHGVSAETDYNFITDELGLPGLLLWIALQIRLLVLVLTRVRRVRDFELRLYLAAMSATFVGMFVMGFGGPSIPSSMAGPFLWFFAGTVAYWFLGPGRSALRPGRREAAFEPLGEVVPA